VTRTRIIGANGKASRCEIVHVVVVTWHKQQMILGVCMQQTALVFPPLGNGTAIAKILKHYEAASNSSVVKMIAER
jgi:uncharacterized membrane protein